MFSFASNPAIASIGGLSFESSPLAVLRAVVAVIIKAVKSHAIQTLAHVSHKVDKAATFAWIPTIADRYTSASVTWIGGITGISTAPKHSDPTLISGSARHTVRGNAIDIGLLSALCANLSLCLFSVLSALYPRRVMTTDKAARVSMPDSGFLAAAALTQLRCSIQPFAVAANVLSITVFAVRAIRQRLTTAASTKRRRSMTAQIVRWAIPKKVFWRNLLSATTFTIHKPIINGFRNGGQAK